MTLAGNLKLRHFLMMIGGAGVLCAGGFFALPMLGVSLLGERADAVPEDLNGSLREVPGVEVVESGTSRQDALDRRVEQAAAEVGLDVTKAPPATASTEAPATAPAGREVDRAVLSWQGKDLGKDKLKDVTQGKPYKVNLYQDAGNSVMNRAKVDLDRDDKWDEKWTFDGPNVSRKVAPADDEDYTESSVWDGSQWVAQ